MRPYFWVGGVKRWPAILRNPPVASLVTSWGFSMSTGARRISVYRNYNRQKKQLKEIIFPDKKLGHLRISLWCFATPRKSVKYLLRKNHLLRITIFNDQKWSYHVYQKSQGAKFIGSRGALFSWVFRSLTMEKMTPEKWEYCQTWKQYETRFHVDLGVYY